LPSAAAAHDYGSLICLGKSERRFLRHEEIFLHPSSPVVEAMNRALTYQYCMEHAHVI